MASSDGSPARSAASSAARASASAAATSPSNRWTPAAEGEDPPEPGVVAAASASASSHSSIALRAARSERRGEREENVGALDAGRHLREELLEDRGCPLAVAREAVEVRRAHVAAAGPGQDRPASARRPSLRAPRRRPSPPVQLPARQRPRARRRRRRRGPRRPAPGGGPAPRGRSTAPASARWTARRFHGGACS